MWKGKEDQEIGCLCTIPHATARDGRQADKGSALDLYTAAGRTAEGLLPDQPLCMTPSFHCREEQTSSRRLHLPRGRDERGVADNFSRTGRLKTCFCTYSITKIHDRAQVVSPVTGMTRQNLIHERANRRLQEYELCRDMYYHLSAPSPCVMLEGCRGAAQADTCGGATLLKPLNYGDDKLELHTK